MTNNQILTFLRAALSNSIKTTLTEIEGFPNIPIKTLDREHLCGYIETLILMLEE